jgi:hypothetical protein
MYKLTLSPTERAAIRYVAARGYARGVADIMSECEHAGSVDDGDPITYLVPEHMAWAVSDEVHANGGSFGPLHTDLTSKLWDLVNEII